MTTITATTLLLCFLLATAMAAPHPRGSCLLLCRENDGRCQSGYECRSNGCGSECYQRPDYSQPEGCPPFSCALGCPLGFVRDERQCDTCRCDYSALTVG